MAAPLTPSAETVAGVLHRARRSHRRRRIVRGTMSALALAGLFAAGPVVYTRLHHPGAPEAEPPAAVVDMATAYPLAEGPLMKDDAPDTDRPANALNWPARGATVSSEVAAAAQLYLVQQAKDSGAASASTEQLWAQDRGGGVFFVLQGWTTGTSGVSQAVLLSGEYAPNAARIVMYEAPLQFSHPSPGEASQPNDVADIAELSVWSPASNRLVVLGAPQVTEVLYAADGRTLIEEPTADGVAVFARTAAERTGYLDAVQVRDAQNQALTPPGTWSAADVVLGGDAAVYTGSGWQVMRTGLVPGAGLTTAPGPVSASDAAGPSPTAPAEAAPSASAPPRAASAPPTTLRGAGAVIRIAPSDAGPAAAGADVTVDIGTGSAKTLVDGLIVPLLQVPAPTATAPGTGAPTR